MIKTTFFKKALLLIPIICIVILALYIYEILPSNKNEFFLKQHQFTVNIKSKTKLQIEFIASFSKMNLNEFENKLYLDVNITGLKSEIDTCEVSVSIPSDVFYQIKNLAFPDNAEQTSYNEIIMPYTPNEIHPEYINKFFINAESVKDYETAILNAKLRKKIKMISLSLKEDCTIRMIVDKPLSNNGLFKKYVNIVINSFSSGQDLKYKLRMPKGYKIEREIESNLKLANQHDSYYGDYFISDTYTNYCFNPQTEDFDPNGCIPKYIFLNLKNEKVDELQGFFLFILGTFLGFFVSLLFVKNK